MGAVQPGTRPQAARPSLAVQRYRVWHLYGRLPRWAEGEVAEVGGERVDATLDHQREERKGKVLAAVRLLVHVLLPSARAWRGESDVCVAAEKAARRQAWSTAKMEKEKKMPAAPITSCSSRGTFIPLPPRSSRVAGGCGWRPSAVAIAGVPTACRDLSSAGRSRGASVSVSARAESAHRASVANRNFISESLLLAASGDEGDFSFCKILFLLGLFLVYLENLITG